MKRILAFIIAVLSFHTLFAQEQIGHLWYNEQGNTVEVGNHILFRTDRTNLDTLTAIRTGAIAYDTLNDVVVVYDGSTWNDLGVTGATGPTGATGAQGPTGPTGAQGDSFFTRNGNDIYPTDSDDYLGIGNTDPEYPLDVDGIARVDTGVVDLLQILDGGSGTNGDVLTRDTDGVAHWSSANWYQTANSISPTSATELHFIGDSARIILGDFTSAVGGFPIGNNGISLIRDHGNTFKSSFSVARNSFNNILTMTMGTIDTTSGYLNSVSTSDTQSKIGSGLSFILKENQILVDTTEGIVVDIDFPNTNFTIGDDSDNGFIYSPSDSTVSVLSPYTFVVEGGSAGDVLVNQGSGVTEWSVPPYADWIIVDEEADFGTPSGGIYTLTANTVYRIVGEVTLTNEIDCNGAILLGGDRTVDKLTSSENTFDMFVNDGSVIARNLTFSVTGTNSRLFNIVGTTGFEYVYVQNCTFSNLTRVGDLTDIYAVQIVNVPNQSPAAGLIIDDVNNVSFRGFDWTTSTADTMLTFVDAIDLIQIFYSAFGVGSGDIGIEVTGLTSLTKYGDIAAGSVFTGDGTYLSGTFGNEWYIMAVGVSTQNDEVANAVAYVSSSSATTISTVDTWTKVAGTTTLVNAFRMDDDSGTNNRVKYLGNEMVEKTVNASISFTSANNNKEYEFAVYHYDDSGASGSIVTHSVGSRKVGTGSDVGSISITALVLMDTDDYVEVHVKNVTDADDPTIEYMTLNVR